jgi:hypothetical protein
MITVLQSSLKKQNSKINFVSSSVINIGLEMMVFREDKNYVCLFRSSSTSIRLICSGNSITQILLCKRQPGCSVFTSASKMRIKTDVASIITRYYLTRMITAPSIDNRFTGIDRRGSEINDWVIPIVVICRVARMAE